MSALIAEAIALMGMIWLFRRNAVHYRLALPASAALAGAADHNVRDCGINFAGSLSQWLTIALAAIITHFPKKLEVGTISVRPKRRAEVLRHRDMVHCASAAPFHLGQRYCFNLCEFP